MLSSEGYLVFEEVRFACNALAMMMPVFLSQQYHVLQSLLEAIPELVSPHIDCFTFTHVARGILVAPKEHRCTTARFHPMKFRDQWHQAADSWLRQNDLHLPSSFISAHFRTEK